MREQHCILAVDIGTSATKVVLFDAEARQLSVVRRHYPVLTPRSGWSEQEPDRIVQAVIDGIGQGLRGLSNGGTLDGIVFSSQLYSIMAVTDDGQLLSQSLTWSDTRSAEDAAYIRSQPEAQQLYQRTGCPVDAIYPLAKIRWLRRELALNRHARFASIKEYVLFQLTGRWVADWSIASATGLFDIHRQRWDETALALLDLAPTALSELASPRQVIGGLRPELGAQLGIAPGTPVVVGGGDGPLASIGVGAGQSGALAINVGTSAAARLLIRQPLIDPGGSLWTYVADEQLWVIGGIVSSGGIVYEWAMRNFLAGVQDAEVGGLAARAEAERLAARVPPGADNLLFVPYLGGEQCPAWNPYTRGSFVGLDFHHDRGHFLRAIFEGITRSIYRIGEQIESALGVSFEQIRTTGGVSTSPLWLQIAADMFGVPIAVPETAEGSARGAAVLGLLALGFQRTLADFPALSESQQLVSPSPEVHTFYDQQYVQFLAALELARKQFSPEPEGVKA